MTALRKSVTRQIRVDAAFARYLSDRARKAGLSLPQYTRRMLARIIERRGKANG